MPNWKKVIISGSNASLNNLYVSNSVTSSIFSGSQFTGSFFGTASWAQSSSQALTASYTTYFQSSIRSGSVTASVSPSKGFTYESSSVTLFNVDKTGSFIIGDSSLPYGGKSIAFIPDGFSKHLWINPNFGNGVNYDEFWANVKFLSLGQSGQAVSYTQGQTLAYINSFEFGQLWLNKDVYGSLPESYTPLVVGWRSGSGAVTNASIAKFAYDKKISFNDGGKYIFTGLDIDSSTGEWNNIGGGTAVNVGLNVKVGAGDIDYAATFTGGNVGIGTASPDSASLTVSGEVFISNILSLEPQDPLPTPSQAGAFAVSSSSPPVPYFYDGQKWNALY